MSIIKYLTYDKCLNQEKREKCLKLLPVTWNIFITMDLSFGTVPLVDQQLQYRNIIHFNILRKPHHSSKLIMNLVIGC